MRLKHNAWLQILPAAYKFMVDNQWGKTKDRICPKDFFVVGVGASAGGLEALEEMFRAMPLDSGMAFVVIQHLSPDFKSHMEKLLSRQTTIPVVMAINGARVEPNNIYLIPAGMEMVISNGALLLTERSVERGAAHPIDQFFRSLATDVGRWAIGIILSGTGRDGSLGIRDIHNAGGLVIVQDEATAKFDGMPISACETGVVDVVLTPESIGSMLGRYSRDRQRCDHTALDPSGIEAEANNDQILKLLLRKSSIDFNEYKSPTVNRRIHRRMSRLGIENVQEYVDRLTIDEAELDELYCDLLIGVTKFYRDVEAFDALRSLALPKMLSNKKSGDTLRIWVAACATGEEAYSIAMLLDEELRRRESTLDYKIFATDIHHDSLHVAGKGVFSESSLQDLPEACRTNYFFETRGGFQVHRALRDKIVFASHNVINDAPFTQMDLVTCRNMLIYLLPAAQRKVLSMFHFALRSGGILFLGPSESPNELSDEFQAIDKRWRLYVKRRDVRLSLSNRVPFGKSSESLTYAPNVVLPVKSNRVEASLIKTYDRLLAKKMGCSILVSETGEMLHIFGGAEKFLKPRGGRPSNHLSEMIQDDLRSCISSAWHHAMTKRVPIQYTSVRACVGADTLTLRINVEPLSTGMLDPNEVLIEFFSEANDQTASTVPPIDVSQNNRADHDIARINSLENELKFSQENLQSMIEEMETSNEELQSANEELIASNEELQSTNEELHSLNEELYTVNAENQRRAEEVARSNDDMDNLLATTRVGVIFLDDELYIRRFTPEIARVFNLKEHDVGRSMEPFSHMLNRVSLLNDLQSVIELQQHKEFTVQVSGGVWYLVRILPYQSGNESRGVVLTIVDITSLKSAESEIELQRHAMDAAVNGIIITNPNKAGNPITYVNHGFLLLTGYTRDEVLGKNCKFLQGPDTDVGTIASIRQSLDAGRPIRVSILNYRKNGTRFWNDLQITPVIGSDQKISHFIGVQNDISDQIAVRAALQDANEASQRANSAKNAFLATISHELRTPMTAVLGFSDMILGETDCPAVVEKVMTIKRNGSYLLSLINDILDLTKIEAGKLQFEEHQVDIRRLVCDVETLLSLRASEAKVPLRFEYATQLPAAVTADEVRVRQIIVNLIENALKFTDSGEVVVSTVTVQHGLSSRLEISVADTGIGISPKQMKRLFVPFNQATKQTPQKFGGTGLGLSICKRLAEGMGGNIRVESKLGIGSRFTLSLPVTTQQSDIVTESSTKRTQTPPPFAKSQIEYPKIDGHVLLADDRRDVWRVGKYFLEKCGAKVTIVENGKQAVQAVRDSHLSNDPFALVLMDMQMPVMGGRDAVALLRSEGFTLPIVALTADAMEGEREACLAMGCDEYFPKPIDGQRLTQIVARLIREK